MKGICGAGTCGGGTFPDAPTFFFFFLLFLVDAADVDGTPTGWTGGTPGDC
jgi:hypothetical protein